MKEGLIMVCPICHGAREFRGPRVGEYRTCEACDGTGVVFPCSTCRGSGWYTPSGFFNTSRRCPDCDGKGYR